MRREAVRWLERCLMACFIPCHTGEDNEKFPAEGLSVILKKFIVLLVCFGFVCLIPADSAFGSTDPQAYLDAEYSIRLDVPGGKLFVTATLKNIRTETLWFGFSNSFHIARQHNLSARISELRTLSEGAKLSEELLNEDIHLYRLELQGQHSVTLSYTFDTTVADHDHHFTQLTSSTLHIPGLDFFLRVFEDVREIQDFEYHHGLYRFKRYEVTLENLPSDWTLLSTYTPLSGNSVSIDDRHGAEVLLSAGRYKLLEISSGEARLRIAIDREMTLDLERYAANIEHIFQRYYAIYQHIPEREILMVIHRDPRTFGGFGISLGGQVKRQNIISTLGWGTLLASTTLERHILGHLAHEGHHIWLSRGFRHSESWYWCSEGFTEYISEKSLYQLGVVSEAFFKKQLGEKFLKYTGLSNKNTVSLVQASLAPKPDREETSLQYDKGALVAFLLDRRLQQQGKDLETFLADFYRRFALSNIPVGNRELIAYLDEYLGDDAFTKEYVLGTAPLQQADFEFGWKYAWWRIERLLPPLPFPFNIIIPFTLVALIFLFVRVLIRLGRALMKH